MLYKKYLFILFCLILPSVSLKAESLGTQTIAINFDTDSKGWIGDFTDYPEGQESFYELAWGWDNLPTPVNHALTKGLFLSGSNHSDDLFMYVRKQVSDLLPNTMYALTISAIIETCVPPGMLGVGGSPGEGVYLKVGASTEEPIKRLENGYYHLSADKGSQSEDGINATIVGDLANLSVDPQNPQYLPKQLITEMPVLVKSDDEGKLWVFFGSDSGFEGYSKFYIVHFILRFDMVQK
jgi:hypothetical protein